MSNNGLEIVRRFQHILKAAAILWIGSGIGLTYNVFLDKGIPLQTPTHYSMSDRINWNLHIKNMRVTVDEARRAVGCKDVVFIDTRSSASYAAGHIPGALNLPASQFRTHIWKFLKDLPKDLSIITYSTQIQSSVGLANLLVKEFGYSRVRVFYDGWTAWTWADYPVRKGHVP